jgi:PhzF family phenazine biosynthesis protein
MMKKSREMRIPLYQVDAFTDELFRGNPAAVCLLSQDLDDINLQAIAAEMNLSETAFLSPIEEGPLSKQRTFALRWFTPTAEVPLCGHATLATSAVLFCEIGISTDEITFQTRSGELKAKREGEGILLDFPADELVPIDPPKKLLEAIGVSEYVNAAYAKNGKDLLVHVESEEQVRDLNPDFWRMKLLDTEDDIQGAIVTSRGTPPYDFISRFFGPWLGIDEDPVTGAAHTILTPYWSRILGKNEMLAYQASQRGGRLTVRMAPDDRVNLIGNAVIVLKGELRI